MSQMQIGERTFAIGCLRDISGRQAYTEALEHRTLHDDLTGLPNRALFCDRVDRALASADRADETRAVLVADLAEFREINETLGQENGDAVLRAVGERLRAALRESDTVARLGSDEFGILPSGSADVERPQASPGRCARRSTSRSSSAAASCTCARTSASRSSRSTAARPRR